MFLKSLFDGMELEWKGAPLIMLLLVVAFIFVAACQLLRILRSQSLTRRALRKNVIRQFRRHLIGRQKHVLYNANGSRSADELFLDLFFDCLVRHIDKKNVTAKHLALHLQLSPRQLNKASRRVTGLSAMQVYDTVKSQYAAQL